MIRVLSAIIGILLYTCAWFLFFRFIFRKNDTLKAIAWLPTIIFAFVIPLLVSDVNFETGYDDPFLITWTILPFALFTLIVVYIKAVKQS